MNIINFKTYRQGKQVLDLAKAVEMFNNKMVVAVQATDISEISEKTGLYVYSQHLDPLIQGRNTGFEIPEAIKDAGASGTLLNHSEHPIKVSEIKAAIEICDKIGLRTVVCAADLTNVMRISKLNPYAIAFEDPDLVSSGKAISKYQADDVRNFVKLLKGKNIVPLCGAGISSREDVMAAKKLGCKGVLISSAIVKAHDPYKKLREVFGK